jgi:hypothetical protein
MAPPHSRVGPTPAADLPDATVCPDASRRADLKNTVVIEPLFVQTVEIEAIANGLSQVRRPAYEMSSGPPWNFGQHPILRFRPDDSVLKRQLVAPSLARNSLRLASVGHACSVSVVIKPAPTRVATGTVFRVGLLRALFNRGRPLCADLIAICGSVVVALLHLFQFLTGRLLHDRVGGRSSSDCYQMRAAVNVEKGPNQTFRRPSNGPTSSCAKCINW